jgi:hypothetical protein
MKITYPSRSLNHPKFKYVPSHKTDLKKTFAKARRLINLQLHREAAQGKEIQA